MKIGLGDPFKNLGNPHQRPKFKMATEMPQKINKLGIFSIQYSVRQHFLFLTKMNPSQNIMMAGDFPIILGIPQTLLKCIIAAESHLYCRVQM